MVGAKTALKGTLGGAAASKKLREDLWLEGFLSRAREAKLEPRVLKVEDVKSKGADAFGRPITQKLTWKERRRIKLGPLSLYLTMPGSSCFSVYRREELLMPIAGERIAYELIQRSPEVEETAVFVEERTDPILAAKVRGQWVELYRWNRRPVLME